MITAPEIRQEVSKNAEQPPVLPAVARGDQEAVRECLDRYGSLIWSLARRSLYRSGEAEDAVQEIFIEVWKNAARFDPSRSSEKNFVALIARRRLIDRLRRDGVRPETTPLDAAVDLPDPTPNQAELGAEVQLASRALAGLKTEQRRLIGLSIQLGMSHGEIAEATRLPLGTVKSHIRRGLATLREQITNSTGLPASA